MSDTPRTRWVSATLSGGEIAAEYRQAVSALRRCEPRAVVFDPTPYAPELLDSARLWWQRTMRTEYESASVLTELALQMRQIDASLDIQAVVLRLAQDELRHAELSARVIEALGGEGKIPAPPLQRLPIHPDCSMEETVLRNTIYCCCLGETYSAARLAKVLGEVRDPFMREAFRQLAADERFHAQFGFEYLQTRRDWLADHPEVQRSLGRYLRYAFAVLERQAGANPPDARPLTTAERELGLPGLAELSRVFQETMLNACIPGLERLGIAAGAAWRARTTAEQPPPE